jgi:glycine cleavage system H protein
MSEIPSNCRYTDQHEWVRVEGDVAVIGLTDYAQGQLGDITFVELPEVGRQVSQAEEFAAIESVKAASDVFAPVAGTVAEANTAVEDDPGMINGDPYGAGWLCKLSGFAPGEVDGLLTVDQYTALLKDLA